MHKKWLISIFAITCIILATVKTWHSQKLVPYYKYEKSLKLSNFEKAKSKVDKKDLELLKLWESTMSGRSGPLSKMMKERYKTLGLNHIFTPSGFHLSAVLLPFMKILKRSHLQLISLIIIGLCLSTIDGLGALKRMVLIKGHQKIFGLHLGFCLALLVDIFFGSFQNSTLSFTYSFMFLGIIYAGFDGLALIFWFFIGQVVLAYFQDANISFLLLVFSPILNLAFGAVMPFLFLLSIPLWDWQLKCGISILRYVQTLVDFCAIVQSKFPSIEINIITLLFFLFFITRRWNLCLIVLIFLSNSLNMYPYKAPSNPTADFVPMGLPIKTIYKEKNVTVYFSDGRCSLKLVGGFWWESCSPRRRSNSKKLKKLSYHS